MVPSRVLFKSKYGSQPGAVGEINRQTNIQTDRFANIHFNWPYLTLILTFSITFLNCNALWVNLSSYYPWKGVGGNLSCTKLACYLCILAASDV